MLSEFTPLNPITCASNQHSESRWSAPEDEAWVDVGEDDSESDYEYEDEGSSAAFAEEGTVGGGGGGAGGGGSVGWRPPPTQGRGGELEYSITSLPAMRMLPLQGGAGSRVDLGVTPPPAPVPTVSPPIPFNINERLGWKRSAEDLTILRVEPHSQAHQAGVTVGSRIASVDGIRVSNHDEYRYTITHREPDLCVRPVLTHDTTPPPPARSLQRGHCSC